MFYVLVNYLFVQNVAIGQCVSVLTGGTVPYQAAVIFFVTIMIIYGWLGGMRSVAYTDTMQGIALLVGVIILLFGSILYFGNVVEPTNYAVERCTDKLGVPDFEGGGSCCS